MNPEEREETIKEINAAIETTPEGVRKFLWSKAYQGLITGLAKQFNLNETQKKEVDEIIFDTLTGLLNSEEETYQRLTAANIPAEKQGGLLEYIKDYFIDPTAAETEFIAETEKEEAGNEEIMSPPSPAEALKSIQEQFTTPTAIIPTQREQSITKPNQEPERKIDPYREPVK